MRKQHTSNKDPLCPCMEASAFVMFLHWLRQVFPFICVCVIAKSPDSPLDSISLITLQPTGKIGKMQN